MNTLFLFCQSQYPAPSFSLCRICFFFNVCCPKQASSCSYSKFIFLESRTSGFLVVVERKQEIKFFKKNTVGWDEGIIGACRYFSWLLYIMLHPLYTQNLWDFLKFIFTIKELFHLLRNLLPLYPTLKFISSCSFKSFSFLYVLYVKVSADEHQCLLRSLSVTSYTLNELFHSALPWEYDVYVPSEVQTAL